MTVATSSTEQLKLLTSDQLDSKYQEAIDNFFSKMWTLKKDVILLLRDILEAQGFPPHKISSRISTDLKGEVSDRYIRETLGKDYTDPLWVRDQPTGGSQANKWGSENPPGSITEMSKEQLRNYSEYLEANSTKVREEMGKRKMAQNLGTTEGTLQNKSVTNTPLHDQQITKPKYNLTEQQKEWQDMIAYECREVAQTFTKMADEFIPSIKIESEAQARRWAYGIKSIHSLFIPAADEKYRLSIKDWIKIIKIMKVHGSSAASKLFKKDVASIRDLDPNSLPEGFDKTLLAMKIEKDTDQVVIISPTKEHLDSRVNIILQAMTEFINRVEGIDEFLEMLESDIALRNFRAAVLSEKLGDSK